MTTAGCLEMIQIQRSCVSGCRRALCCVVAIATLCKLFWARPASSRSAETAVVQQDQMARHQLSCAPLRPPSLSLILKRCPRQRFALVSMTSAFPFNHLPSLLIWQLMCLKMKHKMKSETPITPHLSRALEFPCWHCDAKRESERVCVDFLACLENASLQIG